MPPRKKTAEGANAAKEKENVEQNEQDANEKEKLIADIAKLQGITEFLEKRLSLKTFGDIDAEESNVVLCNKEVPRNYLQELKRSDEKLKLQFLMCAGLWCTKRANDEYVYNFKTSFAKRPNDVFTVQIFDAAGTGKLGKWVMPLSVKIEDILESTPIENIKGITSFVRNCKHHVDVYSYRINEFDELQEIIEGLSNCTLERNDSCTIVTLTLNLVEELGPKGQRGTLVVDFHYSPSNVKPHKVTIESQEYDLPKNNEIAYKRLFNKFKVDSLKYSFEVVTADDSALKWTKSLNDSTLKMTGSSEEEDSVVERPRKRTKVTTKKPRNAKKAKVDSTKSQDGESQSEENEEPVSRTKKRKAPPKTREKVKPKIIQKATLKKTVKDPKSNMRQSILNFPRMSRIHKEDVVSSTPRESTSSANNPPSEVVEPVAKPVQKSTGKQKKVEPVRKSQRQTKEAEPPEKTDETETSPEKITQPPEKSPRKTAVPELASKSPNKRANEEPEAGPSRKSPRKIVNFGAEKAAKKVPKSGKAAKEKPSSSVKETNQKNVPSEDIRTALKRTEKKQQPSTTRKTAKKDSPRIEESEKEPSAALAEKVAKKLLKTPVKVAAHQLPSSPNTRLASKRLLATTSKVSNLQKLSSSKGTARSSPRVVQSASKIPLKVKGSFKKSLLDKFNSQNSKK